jgi:hypothetical protein
MKNEWKNQIHPDRRSPGVILDGEVQTIKIVIFGLLAFLVVCLLIAPQASAQTIQMANPDNIGQRDIIVYTFNNSSGTIGLFGSYNTTSLITIDPNQSYIFTLKPQTTTIDDPTAWMNVAFNYISSNAIPLLILFFIIMLLGRK